MGSTTCDFTVVTACRFIANYSLKMGLKGFLEFFFMIDQWSEDGMLAKEVDLLNYFIVYFPVKL